MGGNNIMLSFCGYNLVGDSNALDIYPTNLTLNQTKISNAIYDHFNITKDISATYTNNIPSWDYNTVLDCNFEDNINGGNLNYTLAQITAIRFKRKQTGTNNWIQFADDFPINSLDDLHIIISDCFCASLENYDWALIPILDGIEGNYIIQNVDTNFNGVFLADKNAIYRLFATVSYGSTVANKEIGKLTPIGSKYPIIISNGTIDYDSGSVNGQLLNTAYYQTRIIDRKAIVDYTNNFKKFCNNGKPKILKDWNGNAWLIMITSSPNINYDNNYGMGVTNISFNWDEQGDINNQQSLYKNGIVEVI
jgi:hypothetical protein